MRYLGLALFAEGVKDHLFLRPLLHRMCERHCLERGRETIAVGDVLELHSKGRASDADRATRIVEAAREARGAWQLLFIHTDGAGDPFKARAERVEPAIEAVREGLVQGSGLGVGVVPVRETEAWALADGDALRRVLGTSLSDSLLGLPTTRRAVERDPDPKKSLRQARRASLSRRRRRVGSESALLESLGQSISIDRLRELRHFEQMELELVHALQKLRYIA